MKLSDVKRGSELRTASIEDLKTLSDDVRDTILKTVSQNGGHLSSNLGMVELTLSLYHVFDFDKDQLLFDVGHQCYTHKLLSGRASSFATLRQEEGICGFPRTDESKYDLWNTGHSSNAISAALGLARARDLTGGEGRVIAVVGDGALTGGMCYEALNDLGSRKTQMIIILNDNGMSISSNVGALSNYLTYLRVSKGWQKLKSAFSHILFKVPIGGKKLHHLFQNFKDHVRNIFVNDKFFSSLGIRYLGPVDGHNIQYMTQLFRHLQDEKEPVIVHVMTKKGKGYPFAEQNPERYHGIGPFDLKTGERIEKARPRSFGASACAFLCEQAQKNPRIVVVNAAMTTGTGFDGFAKAYPKRHFDAGIAEEHAVTLAAGMAKGGLRPFVAIYDTFLQRAYDQIMEDVCFQDLPVVFLMDHAGYVGGDGASHHGMYGISYLRSIPGLTIVCPRNVDEMLSSLSWCLKEGKAPVAIRYPQADIPGPAYTGSFSPGRWECLRKGQDACLLAVGSMVPNALKAAEQLQKNGIEISVLSASSVRPLDEMALKEAADRGMPFFTAEENERSGGFGSAVAEWCAVSGTGEVRGVFALPDAFLPHGSREKRLQECGLDGNAMAEFIRRKLRT